MRAPSPGSTAGKDIQFSLQSPFDARLTDHWTDLADNAAEDHPFCRPQWLIPAARAFGHDNAQLLCGWMQQGDRRRLVFLAPVRFVTWLPGLRVLKIVSWNADYAPISTPLVAADITESVIDALLLRVAADLGVSAILMKDQRVDGPVWTALSAAKGGRQVKVKHRHDRAVLIGPQSADQYFNSAFRRKKRKDFARLRRRLEDHGPVSIEMITDINRADVHIAEFLDLEQAGWKGRNGTALKSKPATLALARDTLRAMMAKDQARIHLMRLAGKPIAGLLVFTAGSEAVTWKIAYDETYARYSPGVLLMLDVSRTLLGDPTIVRTDSLAVPDHPMISHLWTDRMTVADGIVALTQKGAMIGRAAYGLTRVKRIMRAVAGRAARHLRQFR